MFHSLSFPHAALLSPDLFLQKSSGTLLYSLYFSYERNRLLFFSLRFHLNRLSETAPSSCTLALQFYYIFICPKGNVFFHIIDAEESCRGLFPSGICLLISRSRQTGSSMNEGTEKYNQSQSQQCHAHHYRGFYGKAALFKKLFFQYFHILLLSFYYQPNT